MRRLVVLGAVLLWLPAGLATSPCLGPDTASLYAWRAESGTTFEILNTSKVGGAMSPDVLAVATAFDGKRYAWLDVGQRQPEIRVVENPGGSVRAYPGIAGPAVAMGFWKDRLHYAVDDLSGTASVAVHVLNLTTGETRPYDIANVSTHVAIRGPMLAWWDQNSWPRTLSLVHLPTALILVANATLDETGSCTIRSIQVSGFGVLLRCNDENRYWFHDALANRTTRQEAPASFTGPLALDGRNLYSGAYDPEIGQWVAVRSSVDAEATERLQPWPNRSRSPDPPVVRNGWALLADIEPVKPCNNAWPRQTPGPGIVPFLVALAVILVARTSRQSTNASPHSR